MTRTPSILLVSASLALAALWSGALADEGQGGLPAPDPQAKARLSVRWKAPPAWSALEAREGEFAAYRLRRTIKPESGEEGELNEEGPRLVIHYLGKHSERRQVQARRAAWARRFLSPERKRLLPEAAKLRPIVAKEVDPGLAIHLVEVRGDYSAVLAPGQEPRPPQRDWTGIYAHVVAPDGVWVAVLLGPSKVTQAWSGELEKLLRASTSGTVMIRPDPRERVRARPKSAPTPSQTPPAEKAPPAEKTSAADEAGGR